MCFLICDVQTLKMWKEVVKEFGAGDNERYSPGILARHCNPPSFCQECKTAMHLLPSLNNVRLYSEEQYASHMVVHY